ncbi:MAG: MarR family transcriptional regulator [Candidatus Abyssobacteria bacterium SURF_17]|uniref:MarR family transcriptional regulator n=1 Tax=Candidatus Abyssobacteria bacterium SURF_17 TaxID=2093361 RepID=A0A419F9V5_9BACT|nr:MAG: MarR family transcriptional regulator [Candidatus Abyssubacteria bacterium SURF_17]
MKAKENATVFWEAFDKIIRSFSSMNNVSGEESLGKLDIMALEVVSRNEGLIMSELARVLDVRVNTVTGIADRLVERRLLKRERNHKDRRVIRLYTTPKGRKTVEAYQTNRESFFRKLTNILTREEQDGLVSVMVKIAGMAEGKK